MVLPLSASFLTMLFSFFNLHSDSNSPLFKLEDEEVFPSKADQDVNVASCKFAFTSPVRLKNFLTIKDKLPNMLLSGLACNYKCGGCNATYYGNTKRHFKVRICQHLEISHLNEKR